MPEKLLQSGDQEERVITPKTNLYNEDSPTLISIIAEIGVKSVSYSEKFVGLWVENKCRCNPNLH